MALTRRGLLAACLVLPALPVRAEARPLVQVWRDPNCGCCHLWMPHLVAAGSAVQDNQVRSVGAWRRMLGIPSTCCPATRRG